MTGLVSSVIVEMRGDYSNEGANPSTSTRAKESNRNYLNNDNFVFYGDTIQKTLALSFTK